MKGRAVKLEVIVCDVCKDRTKPTEQYTVSHGGRTVKPDLCADHAAYLEELLDEAPNRKPRKQAPRPSNGSSAEGTRRAGRGSTPILSLEEIEERKKARR